LKNLSFELLDIGLHTGQKGLEYLKTTPIYSLTDKYVNYEEKADLLKEKGVQVYRYVHENSHVLGDVIEQVRSNFYVVFDAPSNLYSFMVQVLKDHQPKVLEYMTEQYENVQVLIKDNWMKLDFNNDGKVSLESLKKGVHDLYEFMLNYDYIVKANEIKNNLY